MKLYAKCEGLDCGDDTSQAIGEEGKAVALPDGWVRISVNKVNRVLCGPCAEPVLIKLKLEAEDVK